MNGKPNRGGATDDEVRAYIRSVIQKRDKLLAGAFTKKQMDEVFVLGLDGDEPEEFPELCQAFFKGHARPIHMGRNAQRRWDKENGL